MSTISGHDSESEVELYLELDTDSESFGAALEPHNESDGDSRILRDAEIHKAVDPTITISQALAVIQLHVAQTERDLTARDRKIATLEGKLSHSDPTDLKAQHAETMLRAEVEHKKETSLFEGLLSGRDAEIEHLRRSVVQRDAEIKRLKALLRSASRDSSTK